MLSKQEGDDREADTKVEISVAIRPEIELPDYKGLKIEVDAREASAEDEQKALDELRGRYGTLKTVDRPAAEGDHVTLDLQALVDGEEVDAANDLSYEVGSGTMLEGIDEAVTGLSAGEDATFETTLAGGEHSGAEATVKVKVTAVKERELPEVMVTDELNARRQNVEQQLGFAGISMEKYLEDEGQTQDEFEADLERRVRDAVAAQFILDKIAKKEEFGIDQAELSEHLVRRAQQSGQDPQEFANHMFEHNHIPELVQEILRGKALLPASQWKTTWFKGGSEPGVLTLAYLATTRTGHSYVVAVLAENPSRPIDQATAAPVMLSAVKGAFTLAARG